MTDIYKRICSDPSLSSGDCIAMLRQSNDFELGNEAAHLSERDRQRIGIYVADHVRSGRARSALETAALLRIFEATTQETTRGELFRTMEQETGITRTQLYRLLPVDRCFGAALYQRPEVAGQFVAESLKLLSGESVPQTARDEAIKLAEQGTQIVIKLARGLMRKHRRDEHAKSDQPDAVEQSSPKPPSVRAAMTKRSVRVLWQYADPKLCVLIEPRSRSGAVGGESIIYALERALERARCEYPVEPSAGSLSSSA